MDEQCMWMNRAELEWYVERAREPQSLDKVCQLLPAKDWTVYGNLDLSRLEIALMIWTYFDTISMGRPEMS